jgi:hypothetical protein
MQFHLGKKPASPIKPTDLHFHHYRDTAPIVLPPLPAQFGRTFLRNQPWALLGNDTIGDCVIAGAMHSAMVQGELVGKVIKFDNASAIQTYSEATGYNPNAPLDSSGNNPTDQGTDMASFMDYWKNTGILDAAGSRHKLAAWVRVDATKIQEVLEAIFIFSSVSLGIQFPASAMDQFNNHQLWDVVPGVQPDGGHCIEAVSRYSWFNVITWGQPQGCTPAFLTAFMDEAFIPVSEDMLDANGIDSDKFNLAQLIADANADSV